MLYSGLKISAKTTLPAAPQEGQMTMLTQVDGSHNPGTYIYRNGQWRVMDDTAQNLSVIEGTGINASIVGNDLTIAVDTAVVATNSYADNGDAATLTAAQAYADAIKHNFEYKDSVYCASTANVTLSGSRTIDGQTPPNGSRVLIKDQTDAKQNGIYVTNNSGAWSRATDADANSELTAGTYVYVERGTVNQKTAWVLSTTDAVIGTSNLDFVQFGITAYSAGAGLALAGNTFSMALVGTAGTYGSATQIPVITTNDKGQVTGVTLQNINASVSTEGDLNYSNVSLLLHMDGDNGSTNFADSSSSPKTVGAINGTPALSTAQAKFGSSSLLLNNTGTSANSSDTLRIASGGAGGAFDLSTGDFTIEFHIRPAAAQTTRLIIGSANALFGTGGWGIRLDSGSLVLLGSGNGQGSVSWAWSANTWYHIAVCRSGATTKIFVDGTQVGSNLTPTFAAESAGSYVYLGAHASENYNASYGFNGHLDEVRITKGVARYTANFTAPSAAYKSHLPLVTGVTAGAGISVTSVNPNSPTISVSSTFTPYDICSCVLGKPDAGATVFMALAVRAFNIPSSFTGSQAKASTAATASSVFTVYKNGSSIGTFTFAASGSTATFSGAGGSIVAGDLLTIVAPGSQDATLANIAFTLAGNLQ